MRWGLWRIRRTPPIPGGVFAGVIFVGLPAVIVACVLPYLGWDITPWGYANLALADTLISWYVLDTFVSRRSAFHFLGAMEAPLSPLWRFWRRVLLLASALATIGAVFYGGTKDSIKLQDLAFWLGPSLAAFGWMYTAFEKEKSDRATKTLSAIQEQLYSAHLREIAAQLKAFRIYCREHHGDPADGILPLNRMSLRLRDIPEDQRPIGHPDRKLSDAVDEFLNALDLLSFGVRQGDLDFRAVEMILRQRLVKNAYTFSDYIWQQTGALPTRGRIALGKLGTIRYRSTSRTWEHYLWLVANLDILEDDKVNRDDIVRPPPPIRPIKVR